MWARISLFLVAGLLLATAAGAWFGHLLVENAPLKAAPPRAGEVGMTTALLGADGRQAGVPEPPQPRVDGTLGLLPRGTAAAGDVPLVSVFDQEDDPGIAVTSDAGNDSGELDALMAGLGNRPIGPGNSGIPVPSFQDDGRYGQQPHAGAAGPTYGIQPTRQPDQARELPPELAFAVARPAEPTQQPATPAWQESLRASLNRCGTQRFFSEAECEARLRVQYCEPNQAWGRIAECPAAARTARF